MLDSSLLHDQVNRVIMSQQSHGDLSTVISVCWAKASRVPWLELFVEGGGGRGRGKNVFYLLFQCE